METLDDELSFFAIAQGCVGKWNDKAVVDTPLAHGKTVFLDGNLSRLSGYLHKSYESNCVSP